MGGKPKADTGNAEEVRKALRMITEGERRLQELGVLRTKRGVWTQVGEWLAVQVEEGQPATSRSQRDWDGQVGDAKFQVKTDRKAKSTRQWRGTFPINKSTIDRLAPDDFVICIQFGEDGSIEGYYRVGVREIRDSWTLRSNKAGVGYRVGEGLQDHHRRECAPLDRLMCRPGERSHVVILELSDIAYKALKERMAGPEAGTPDDAASELLLEALFPVPEEYGEPTEEERDQIIREAFGRDDLWGPEEDTYCAQLAGSDQGTSSSCPPQALSRRKSGR